MIDRRFAAAAATLAVAACAAFAPAVPEAPPFDLTGRLLVRYDARALTSGLRWRHTPTGDEIALLTPLGQTLAQIVTGAEGATLTTADGRRYQASSVASLTRQGLGWSLPLELMRYWVRGEVAPGVPAENVARDAAGRLARLEQGGWHITLRSDPAPAGGHPDRLDFESGEQRIRLVIDDWRVRGAAK